MNLAINSDQARFNMIEQQIRPWDVHSPQVLELLGRIRREDFVPEAYQSLAFADFEIPLGEGQFMLAPKIEARILNDLQVKPTDRVLEIGTGSGFMAALLGHLSASVLTLEVNPILCEFARRNLAKAQLPHVEVRLADGSHGALHEAPFDVIVLSGSVPEVPSALLNQLAPGGRLFAIVGNEPMMRAQFITHPGHQTYDCLQPWDTVAPRLLGFSEPSSFRF
jgi:protein-L-isoaspartate(D-aspartate) O-methyltransferase